MKVPKKVTFEAVHDGRTCMTSYEIITGASGSILVIRLILQLLINCTSGRVHVNLYLDFNRAYPKR